MKTPINKWCAAALLCLMFIGGAAAADQIIKLNNGKTVHLMDDGTWEYIDETITGVLTLDFGTTLDQQGRCYAWPRLTNDTNKFVDGVAIDYSTHFSDGKLIKNGTLNFNIVAVGRRSEMQEYLTKYNTAKCDEVAYVQIDGIKKCKIGGIKRSAQTCYDMLVVTADEMIAVK